MKSGFRASWVVLLTVVIALILSIWSIPESVAAFWPHWTVLVVIYWCLALPERIGIGIAWIIGLLLDVLFGSVLGEHALALSLVAFVLVKTHSQVRIYPLLQQTLVVAALVVLYEFVLFWIDGIMGLPARPMTRWLPTVTSVLAWPVIFGVLRFCAENTG